MENVKMNPCDWCGDGWRGLFILSQMADRLQCRQGRSSIRPSSDQYLVLMKQGFQYSFQIWIKAWTCQAWMHLNIEQPSIISFLGPALEMKGKRVERPGLVKRFKSADICISLKSKCISFVIGGSVFDISFFLSPGCPAFRCVMGKTAPILMVTDYIYTSIWSSETDAR